MEESISYQKRDIAGLQKCKWDYSLREISRNLKTNSLKPFRSQDNVLEIINITITRVCVSQCDRENLEYFRNVYCVMTNHSKDQDMWTDHKTTN